MAKHKYIETPEKLKDYWEEYKKSLKIIDVPVTHPRLGMIALPMPEPIHERAFNNWLVDNYDLGERTVHKYFNCENDNSYSEYRATITYIKNDIFSHNLKYSAVGIYKEKLIMALLGLANKNENKNEHSGTINANFGSTIQPPSKSEENT